MTSSNKNKIAAWGFIILVVILIGFILCESDAVGQQAPLGYPYTGKDSVLVPARLDTMEAGLHVTGNVTESTNTFIGSLLYNTTPSFSTTNIYGSSLGIRYIPDSPFSLICSIPTNT